MQRNGFTLIELMVVIVIVGILAALATPAFYRMRERAREAAVRTNAHTVQLAAEDFAAQNNGVYATDDTSALPSGDRLSDMVPNTLRNPFDRLDPTAVVWNGAADAVGRIGYDTSLNPGAHYAIDGQGEGGIVVIAINNGS